MCYFIRTLMLMSSGKPCQSTSLDSWSTLSSWIMVMGASPTQCVSSSPAPKVIKKKPLILLISNCLFMKILNRLQAGAPDDVCWEQTGAGQGG